LKIEDRGLKIEDRGLKIEDCGAHSTDFKETFFWSLSRRDIGY
jgi:hypothetical protein